jgi:RimJ/RimL family protein N-acetyltransferase
MTDINAPSIETGRLILRLPTPSDLDEWAANIFADPDVIRYMHKRDMTPLERAERVLGVYTNEWIDHPYGGWIIRDKATGEFIGNCHLEHLEKTDEVEHGYAFAKAFWGRGIATEAARAVVRFGFEYAQLDRIIAVVVAENIGSWHVLEKAGYTFERDGQYDDLLLKYYAITRAQFEQFQQTQPDEFFYRLIEKPE